METMENNLPSATHQEKAKKMKKLRRWQIAISLFGVAIIVWGVIEVICLFLNYSQTETSNDAPKSNTGNNYPRYADRRFMGNGKQRNAE